MSILQNFIIFSISDPKIPAKIIYIRRSVAGAQGARAPSCISYFGSGHMSLNRGAIHFTLGLRPCIISSFLIQIYLRPPLKISQLRPLFPFIPVGSLEPAAVASAVVVSEVGSLVVVGDANYGCGCCAVGCGDRFMALLPCNIMTVRKKFLIVYH